MMRMYGHEKASGLESWQILIGRLGIRSDAHVNVTDDGATMVYGIAIDKKMLTLDTKVYSILKKLVDIKNEKIKTFTVESVMDFMEFDRVEDNMIIEKNGSKFIMIIECQGINYDLMSEVEKML